MAIIDELHFPEWKPSLWYQHPRNPLISPLSGQAFRGVIGDPQVLVPGEFDDQWHLFGWSNDVSGQGSGIAHFVSPDGTAWSMIDHQVWHCGPFNITAVEGRWIAYYTAFTKEGSVIKARTSKDLRAWSEPVDVLLPELEWEREGRRIQVRNPCLVIMPDGRYRLYYSGGTVWMDDMGFEEPKYIGLAESSDPLGMFEKHKTPILGPDAAIPHRNHGAGALRVYWHNGQFLGLLNGIYLDERRRSRSAIGVFVSRDGVTWREAPYNPIVAPSSGWCKALIYQMDLVAYENKLWLFYNARSEWLDGTESIGCSLLDFQGEAPRKLWRLPCA